MRYRTILFDADGTLFDFKRSEHDAVKEAFMMSGIEVDEEMIAKYSEINDSLWKQLEKGLIEKATLLYRRFELFGQHYGIALDAQKLAKDYMLTLSSKCYLFAGARELCEKLTKQADLYIVTNGVESTQRGRFYGSHLDLYFKDLFISGAIGAEKPSARFFEHVARHIPSFEKEKTVIVGDSLSSDIKGGILYGIDTCWFNPQGNAVPAGMNITCVAKNYDEIYEFLNGCYVEEA